MHKFKNGTPNSFDTRAAIDALEYLMASKYISKKRLYFENFVRGIFFSLGTIVGLAIVSTLVLGILSQFDDAKPIDNLKKSIESNLESAQ